LTLRKVGAHFGPLVSKLRTQHKLHNITEAVYMQDAFAGMNYSNRHWSMSCIWRERHIKLWQGCSYEEHYS